MTVNESYVQKVDNKFVARFSMGKDFSDYRSVIEYALDNPGTTSESSSPGAATAIINSIASEQLTAKRRDTSVGGNDAVNCYYQFNEHDDLVHPINRVGTDPHNGLGRVYNEVFDSQQNILYISFGVPKFANAATFIADAYDTDLATLMNSGETSTVNKIAGFLGAALGTVLIFPFLPIKFAFKIVRMVKEAMGLAPTKYYDFRPTMALYYKQVNTILAHLAANMNLIKTVDDVEENTAADQLAGVPRLLRKHGLDILTILSRKQAYDGIAGADTKNMTDKAFDELLADAETENGIWSGVKDGFHFGFTEAMKYVGFRIEKSVDSTESASSTTKESELAKVINGFVSTGRSAHFNLAGLTETTAGSVMKSAYDAMTGILTGGLDLVGIAGGLEVMKGSGYIDIPEVWESSSFQKSYTFDFQLRTPYADKISIFYSLYIPLAMLIAGSFPRSTGTNSYTSPFIVRAFSKGLFAIPLGIIDSITIKRGAAEYGWSRDMLPTQIDVSFTIKDLSPVMHVPMMNVGMKDWMKIVGQNSSFQEYLLTLSGTDLAQRQLITRLAVTRAKALMTITSNNVFNPLMISYSLTNTWAGNLLTNIYPLSRLPGAVPKLQD